MIQKIKKFFGLNKPELQEPKKSFEDLNSKYLKLVNDIPDDIKESSEYKDLLENLKSGNAVYSINPKNPPNIFPDFFSVSEKIYWIHFDRSSGKITASYSENGHDKRKITLEFTLKVLEVWASQRIIEKVRLEQEQKEFEENKRILLGLGNERNE